MFCGYCGKSLLDDMVFCPYCGKALNKDSYAGTNDTNNETVNSNEVVSSSADDWSYYNSIQLDATDLPDIQGDYLVLGNDRLLRADITRYIKGKDNIIIEDKDGKSINISIPKLGASTYAKLGAAIGLIGGGLVGAQILMNTELAKDEDKLIASLNRIWLQMARVTPLCGDDTLKKQCNLVSNIISKCSSFGRIIPWFYAFDFVKKFDESEQLFLATNDFLVTNRRLLYYGGNLAIKFSNIIKIDKTKLGLSISQKNGTVNKISSATIKKETADVLNDCLSYYKQGRMDEFMQKEYKDNSAIIKL